MPELPRSVRIREVGPRDGFQNEPEVIATADKVRLIDCLSQTGLARIELTSFVRPDVIPQLSDAREEIGFIPWMFGLPDPGEGCESAWLQLADPQGFRAPFGITTAERRHPQFRSHNVGTCEWDGAVWPFATSQTLNGLANVLRDQRAGPASRLSLTSKDYFSAFLTYVHSQHADGKPYLGEYLDEVTGDWINGKSGRSRYYNHSTFADLLITGVVGLRPRADDMVEVFPLLPATPRTGTMYLLL